MTITELELTELENKSSHDERLNSLIPLIRQNLWLKRHLEALLLADPNSSDKGIITSLISDAKRNIKIYSERLNTRLFDLKQIEKGNQLFEKYKRRKKCPMCERSFIRIVPVYNSAKVIHQEKTLGGFAFESETCTINE